MQIIQAYYEPVRAVAAAPKFDATEVATAFGCTSASLLGAGTFGETWRLTTPGLLDLAAKLIFDPNYPLERLDREVQGLQRAQSPHVVKLVEHQQVAVGGALRSALLFEYINGGDVAGRLQLGAALPAEDVRRFALGVVAGVMDLHAHQTVHRDIKPENIALREGDWAQPVLLDLGLAKVLDQQSLTAYPALMGTVPFMAPEQLRGERARQMADMFSVGVVLHLLLTGRHPFYGPRAAAVDHHAAIGLLEAGAPALPPDTPADLATLVQRLLAPQAYLRGSAARAFRDLTG